jgi:hypothetical protein
VLAMASLEVDLSGIQEGEVRLGRGGVLGRAWTVEEARLGRG